MPIVHRSVFALGRSRNGMGICGKTLHESQPHAPYQERDGEDHAEYRSMNHARGVLRHCHSVKAGQSVRCSR